MRRLVVPASQRDAFYWQLHVTLDHAKTTSHFAELLLSEIGIEAASRAPVTEALRAGLPTAIDEIDVTVVATILAQSGVLSWVEDIRLAPPGFAEALERMVTDTLRAVPRGAMPRPVAEELVAKASLILGELLDPEMARAMHAAILKRLQCDLWRRHTEEQMLVSWLCHDMRTHARC